MFKFNVLETFLTELLANKLKTFKFENWQMFAVNIVEFSLNKERQSKNWSIPQNPPLEIRLLYIQVYSVRYVNIS